MGEDAQRRFLGLVLLLAPPTSLSSGTPKSAYAHRDIPYLDSVLRSVPTLSKGDDERMALHDFYLVIAGLCKDSNGSFLIQQEITGPWSQRTIKL